MDLIRKNMSGVLLCGALAVPAAVVGQMFPVIGGPVLAIIAGMPVSYTHLCQGNCSCSSRGLQDIGYVDGSPDR